MTNGSTIGSLHLLRRIGAGGMGEVWLARDEALGVDRAVKLLLPERAGDAALRARFAAEARTLAALGDVPGVVRVHAAGEDPATRRPFFVMDAHLLAPDEVRAVCTRRLGLPVAAAEAISHAVFAESKSHAESAEDAESKSHAELAESAESKSHAERAEDAERSFTLQDALGDEAAGTARQIPERAVLSLAREIAAALARLHGRAPPVVHRDLKPSNLLFAADGRLLLADFGVAKTLESAQTGLTRTGAQPGTQRYAAPELLRGDPATPAADWYALGVVLFRALTSSFPQWGEAFPTSAGLRPFSPLWEPLLRDLLAPNPARRLTDAAAFARRLDQIGNVKRSPSGHIGKKRVVAAAAIAVLSFCAVVAALFLSATDNEPNPEPTPAVQENRTSTVAPAPVPVPDWDDEDRFVARRDLKKLLLGWKQDILEKMCADPDDPAPDAQGTAVLSAGKTFLVGELESSGAAKLVLDGGRLVAQRPSAEEVRAARARWDALLADVEADRVPDERLRDGIDFAKKEFDALGLHDGEPPPSLSVPVEVGPAGGILEGMSGPCDVLGKFVPGPRGAGVIAIRGTASFRENGLSPDVPLEGAYTILDSAGEYVHLHLPPVSPANAHGSNPEQSFREACETARRPRPDGNGDIVVRSGETLILSDVPLDGSVKRIVLRGGTLAFLPPASDRNGFVEIMTFDLPIVVGKEGGEIGACRWTDASLRRLRGVGEARLRSPVSNEFGERPSVVVCGDVFLDADRFSPKVRAVTFREFPRPVASPVFGGHGAPSDRLSPRTELDPGTGDYRFCDFRGPFPRETDRRH